MPIPTTDQCLNIANDFFVKWNFPNCIGAIDGKHVKVKSPHHSGSLYYNYKQYFSILLQAVVDANCKFIAVDIGTEGRQCDSSNFRSSTLFQMLDSGRLNIPTERAIPGTNITTPFVLIGDGGYPLLDYLMKPFPERNSDDRKRIYNYRLSRARRSVECAFGIMASKWRILQKAIETDVSTAIKVTKAVCILHNFVMENEQPSTTQEENTENVSSTISSQESQHRYRNRAINTRNIFVHYFNGSGSVPWQMNCLPQNIIDRDG